MGAKFRPYDDPWRSEESDAYVQEERSFTGHQRFRFQPPKGPEFVLTREQFEDFADLLNDVMADVKAEEAANGYFGT